MLQLHEVSVALPRVGGTVSPTKAGDTNEFFSPVKDFSLAVAPGEIVGLRGPSGCGKTVLCSAVMGLLEPPGHVAAGQMLFAAEEGRVDLAGLDEKGFAALRGREMAMIFQDPVGALNPSRTIARQFAAAVRAHARPKPDAAACRALAEGMLAKMQFEDPARILASYPFELSGGMCQRVAVAMAMIHRPRLLIADEPTTALDVKNQAGLLRLLASVREEAGTGILLVSHDGRALSSIADRVVEMPA